MFNIIKDVINSKNYKLEDILYKINRIWIEGGITEEQKTELDNLARENANTDNSLNVLEKIKELDLRIQKLENKEETETEQEYPEYKKGKWYYRGMKASENGKKYICIAPEGQVCTWSPTEYPLYWEEVTEESEVQK